MDEVRDHFDQIADKYDSYKQKNAYYYNYLKQLLIKLIDSKTPVLEIGCGTGEILAAVNPKKGYGIDISSEMIALAKRKYKHLSNLSFTSDAVAKFGNKNIKCIFMVDVVEHVEDLEQMTEDIAQIMNRETTLIITMANPRWEWLLAIAENLGLKMPEGKHIRRSYQQIKAILAKNNLSAIRHDKTLLVPVKIPLISQVANRYFENLLKPFAFIEYMVAVKQEDEVGVKSNQ